MHKIGFVLLAPALSLFSLTAPAKPLRSPAKPAIRSKVKGDGATKDVASVLKSYRDSAALKAKVKKTVTQEALGTVVKSEGEFYFSKGKLRLEIREPEHSLLVFDGKTVWFETPLDEERVHVTKMRANELKKADSLLTALFDRKDALKTFKLKSRKVDGEVKTYVFEPKDKKKSEVQMLEIALKSKDIQRLVYTDQVENRVQLEFSDVTKGPVPADKFAYKMPAKAELVEM